MAIVYKNVINQHKGAGGTPAPYKIKVNKITINNKIIRKNNLKIIKDIKMYMPIKGWKSQAEPILGDLREEFNIKSELWNDIRILLTEKYDVSYLHLMNNEFIMDDIIKELEEII